MDERGRIEREEIEAALEARRELGPTYEPAVVEAFVERIERAVEERVDSRLADRKHARKDEDDRSSKQLALGIVSLALGIPISAISGEQGGLPGLLVSWAGIVGVNWAYVVQNRRLPPPSAR